jgi:hypothetical protein
MAVIVSGIVGVITDDNVPGFYVIFDWDRIAIGLKNVHMLLTPLPKWQTLVESAGVFHEIIFSICEFLFEPRWNDSHWYVLPHFKIFHGENEGPSAGLYSSSG